MNERPTPETSELRGHLEQQVVLSSYGWAIAFEAMAGKCEDLERQRDEAIAKLAAMEKSITDLSHPNIKDVLAQRDEAREQCDTTAKQLLETVNDRNSLGVQLDLLRDEFQRITARIRESGLSDNPHLSAISDYCQRAQKDIAVRYTPIEERDRACERLAVVMLQLEDCKAQRDELLAALEESLALNINWADSTEPDNLEYFSEYRAVIAQARAAIAAVKGAK